MAKRIKKTGSDNGDSISQAKAALRKNAASMSKPTVVKDAMPEIRRDYAKDRYDQTSKDIGVGGMMRRGWESWRDYVDSILSGNVDPYEGYATDPMSYGQIIGSKETTPEPWKTEAERKQDNMTAYQDWQNAEADLAQYNEELRWQQGLSSAWGSPDMLLMRTKGFLQQAQESGDAERAAQLQDDLDFYEGYLNRQKEAERQQQMYTNWDREQMRGSQYSGFQQQFEAVGGEEGVKALQAERTRLQNLAGSEEDWLGYGEQQLKEFEDQYGNFLDMYDLYGGTMTQGDAGVLEAQADLDAAMETYNGLVNGVSGEPNPEGDAKFQEELAQIREEYVNMGLSEEEINDLIRADREQAWQRYLNRFDSEQAKADIIASDEEISQAAKDVEDARLILAHAQLVKDQGAMAQIFSDEEAFQQAEAGLAAFQEEQAGLGIYATKGRKDADEAQLKELEDTLRAQDMPEDEIQQNLAQERENLERKYRGDYAGSSYWDPEYHPEFFQPDQEKWSEEQQLLFGYYYQMDPERAKEYAAGLNLLYKAQEEGAEDLELQEYASRNWLTGAWASLLSVPESLLGGTFDYAKMLGEYSYRGGLYESVLDGMSHDAEIVRGTIGSNLNNKWGVLDEDLPVIGGKGVGDAYQLGMSILDSFGSRLFSGGSAAATNLMFFGTAASSKARELHDQDYGDREALLTAFGAGAAEGIGETASLEALFGDEGLDALKKGLLRTMHQQGFFEMSEEGVTTMLNWWWDDLVNGDNSEYNRKIRGYEAAGMSAAEARTKANTDRANEIGFDMLGGGLSGEISAGVHYTASVAIPGAMQYQGGDAQEMMDQAALFTGDNAADRYTRSLADQYAASFGRKGSLSNRQAALLGAAIQDSVRGNVGLSQDNAEVVGSLLGDFNRSLQDKASAITEEAANTFQEVEPAEELVRESTGQPDITEENYGEALQQMQAEEEFTEADTPEEKTATSERPDLAGTVEAEELIPHNAEDEGPAVSTEQTIDATTAVLDWLEDPSKEPPIEGLTREDAEAAVQELAQQLGLDTSPKAGLQTGTQVDKAIQRVRQATQALSNVTQRRTQRQLEWNEKPTTTRGTAGKVTLEEGEGTIGEASFNKESGQVQVSVKMADGSTRVMDANQLTGEAGYAFEILDDMLEPAQAAQAFNMMNADQNVTDYAVAFGTVRRLGEHSKAAFSPSIMNNRVTGNLTEDQARAAYTLGQSMTTRAGGKPIRKFSLRGTGKVTLEGGVLNEGTENEQKLAPVSETNRKAHKGLIDAVRETARVLGIDVVFFESKEGVNGNLQGANGAYQDGVIYLDINAGMKNLADVRGRMLFVTLAHELTHFIKENAPEHYQVLQDRIVEYLQKDQGLDFNKLIESKIARSSKRMSYDDALEEVIADSCETMLRNSQAVQQLAAKEPGLFNTMRDYIQRFFNRILARHAEAKSLQPHMKEIQKIWDQALIAAVENRVEPEVREEIPTQNEFQKYIRDMEKSRTNGEDRITRLYNQQQATRGRIPTVLMLPAHVEQGDSSVAPQNDTGTRQKMTPDVKRRFNRAVEGLMDAYMMDGEELSREEAEKMVMDYALTHDGYFDEIDEAKQKGEWKTRKQYAASQMNRYEQEMVDNLGEDADVETNSKGDLLAARSEDGSTVVYSEATYRNGGRDKLAQMLRQNGHTRAEIKQTLAELDSQLDFLHELGGEYAVNMGYEALQNHLQAEIVTYIKSGERATQALSTLVNNGEYPVNLDLALICKKRVAYMRMMTKLIEDGIFSKVNFAGDAIADVNMILRNNGFETACLGCFVEARRLQLQKWAETIVKEWNAAVDARNPNAEYFGFAEGMKELSPEQIQDLVQELENAGEKNDKGNVKLKSKSVAKKMGELQDRMPSLQKKLTIADLLTPKGMSVLRTYDQNLFSLVKQRYGAASPKIVQEFNPYNSEIADLGFKFVKDMTGNAVKGAQKFEKAAKEELGPKRADETDEEYNARVETLALRNYLYKIGGARIQSFSDFMIENLFDYLQILNDLSARELPMHGYTKEASFVRIFGMTGIKINGSWIAHTERSMGKEYAGLLPVEEASNGRGIVVTVNGKDYAICMDDYARNQATGSFIQSIGLKDMVALQLDPRYSANVGSITIGVSDNQILAMLDNDLFRMIIPYHASGMLKIFAELVGVDAYNDYTKYQNTRVKNIRLVNGGNIKRTYNANTGKEKFTNAQGKELSIDTSYAFNETVQRLGDAKAAADEYLRWCAEEHPVYDGDTLVGYATFSPKFSDSPFGTDFTKHPNYYKLLEDFTSYDMDGVSALQGAATVKLPSVENRMTASQMAAYKQALKNTGIFTDAEIEKYARKADMTFEDIVREEVHGRASYENAQAKVWDKTVEEVEKTLLENHPKSAKKKKAAKMSDREIDKLQSEYEEALEANDPDWQAQLVNQAGYNAGYTVGAYHGSPVKDITTFNTRSDGTGKQSKQLLFGTHFTRRKEYAEIYARKAKNSKGTSRMTATGFGRVYDVLLDLGKSLDLQTAKNYTPGSEMYSLYEDMPERIRKKVQPRTFSAYDTEQGLGSGQYVTASQIEQALQLMSPKEATDFLVDHGYNSVLYLADYSTAMANNRMTRDPSIIMLDPERIKSADPVTYDDNGNVIPLSERFNKETGDIRYSIRDIVGSDGKNYGQGVYLDTDIFDGVKPRNWGPVLGKFVYDNLNGAKLTMYDDEGNPETVYTARDTDVIQKIGANRPHKALSDLAFAGGNNVKALVTVHLAEALKASNPEENLTDDNSHDWFDEYGWIQRHVIVETVTGKIYDATINIANGRRGLIAYQVGKIRRLGDAIVTSTGKPGGTLRNTKPSGKTIPQQNKNRKTGAKKSDRDINSFTSKADIDAEIERVQDLIRDIQNAQWNAREAAKSDPRVQEAQARMWKAEDEKGRAGSLRERMEYNRILKQVKEEQAAEIPEGDLNELAKRVTDLKELREQFLKVTPITPAQYNKLVKHFGTTTDFSVAGFILQDGRMLDFSGKKQYGSAYAGGREVYHNEVGDVLNLPTDTSPRIDMVSNGNIRLVPEINGINLSQKPTAAQKRVLRDLIEHYNGNVHVDIDNAAGRTIETFGYYNGTSASRILSDIDNYFDTGEAPAPVSNLRAFYSERDEARTDRELLMDTTGEKLTRAERQALQRYREKVETYEGLADKVQQAQEDYDEAVRKGAGKETVEKARVKLSNLEKRMNRALNEVTGAETNDKTMLEIIRKEREIQRRRTNLSTRDTFTRRELRGKITKLWGDLNRRITSPSEKKNIPVPVMMQAVQVLEAINMDYTRDGSKAGEKLRDKLLSLQQKYKQLENDPDFKNAAVYDKTVAEFLDSMIEAVGDTPINRMNAQQMQAVYETLKALDYTARTALKIKMLGEERDAYLVSKEAGEETRSVRKPSKNLLAQWLNAQLSPERMFNRLGGYRKDSTWSQLYRMLNDGQLKATQIQMEGAMIFDGLLEGKDYDKFINPKETVDIGLKDRDGNSILITHGMMAALYLHLQNEQNARHVAHGGLTVPNLRDYYNGRNNRGLDSTLHAVGVSQEIGDLRDQLRDAETDAEKDAIKAQIAEAEERADEYIIGLRMSIEKKLTAYDRKWLAAAQELFDNYSKRQLNETTMDVYGIKRANVENYFPLSVNKDFLNTPFESIAKDMSLENAGFMKERVDSGKPIYLFDVSDVAKTQIRRVSQYCGLMPVTRNFQKVWGKVQTGYRGSLQDDVRDKFGTAGITYIENLMADLNGARGGREGPLADFFNALRGNMAQATLTLSLRTAMSQTASYPTAASVVGWKALGKALAAGGKGNTVISRADQELIRKYSPLLWYRLRNGSTVELGDIAGSNSPTAKLWKKMRWATGWIQAMDGATVGRLWYAAQYYVDDHNKALKKGTDAYYQEVAKVFNDIVEKSQPNYTTMQRPDILRNPNALVRQLTMFLTQRLQNFNILYDSAATYSQRKQDLKNGRATAADVREARTTLKRAAVSQVVAAVTIAAFKFLADGILHSMNAYRDDDDELTRESISKELLDMFLDSLTGNVLGGSEVYDLVEKYAFGKTYYGIDVAGVSTVTDVIDAANKFFDAALTEGATAKDVWNKGGHKLTQKVAALLGIPEANAEKIVKGMIYHATDIINGEPLSYEAGVDRTTAQQAHRLYRAYTSSNYGTATKIREQVGDDEKLNTALKTYIKQQYADGKISKDEAQRQLEKFAGMHHDAAEKTVREYSSFVETGIKYDEIGEKYIAGELSYDQAQKMLQKYGGKDAEDAAKRMGQLKCEKDTGVKYSEIDDDLRDGRISESRAAQLWQTYGGMDATKAGSKAMWTLYENSNPDTKLTDASFLTYYKSYKPIGFTPKMYEGFKAKWDAVKGTDKNHDGKADAYSKKKDRVKLIDSLPLTKKQKDALYNMNWSTGLKDAPWH